MFVVAEQIYSKGCTGPSAKGDEGKADPPIQSAKNTRLGAVRQHDLFR